MNIAALRLNLLFSFRVYGNTALLSAKITLQCALQVSWMLSYLANKFFGLICVFKLVTIFIVGLQLSVSYPGFKQLYEL
jgi:hypothetical protein